MHQVWDTRAEWPFPLIIDNLMNLELLLWATVESGNPKFRAIAVSHADMTLRNRTGSFPRGSEVDVPLSYAGCYFLEALARAGRLA